MRAEVRSGSTSTGARIVVVWVLMDLGLGKREWIAVGTVKPGPRS